MGHWIDTGMEFHFSEPMEIERIAPLEIDYGVEFIRVKGQGFSAGTDLMCCFGGGGKHIYSEAIVLSNTTIRCPLSWEVTTEALSQISLSVTSNGVDFVRSASSVTYKSSDEAVIRSLSPALGPAFGSSSVDVYGIGFQENMSATCWFGNVGTRATYVSGSHVQCLSSPVFIKESKGGLSLTPQTSLA